MLGYLAEMQSLCWVSAISINFYTFQQIWQEFRHFIHVAEKAKYLYTYIRTALNVPNFTDEEQAEIDELETYLEPMHTCNSTGFCR